MFAHQSLLGMSGRCSSQPWRHSTTALGRQTQPPVVGAAKLHPFPSCTISGQYKLVVTGSETEDTPCHLPTRPSSTLVLSSTLKITRCVRLLDSKRTCNSR